MRTLRFFQPDVGSEIEAAFGFYRSFTTEYLWPRSFDEIRAMADDGQLFGAERDGNVLAACYMKPDSGGSDGYEFGGVLVHKDARGEGIGSTLGRVALGSVSAMATPGRIIAHVHEDNMLPRQLLLRLGFVATGTKEGPPQAPPGMKRNAQGKVMGDVYEFDFARFEAIADWIEAFAGVVKGKPADIPTILDRVAVASDLRALATAHLP